MTKLLKSRLLFTSVNDEFPGASPGLLLYIEYKYETLRIFFKDNTVDVSQTRKSYIFFLGLENPPPRSLKVR